MILSKLLEGVEILENTADMDMEISGLCYDSRKAENGSLFVAVRGFQSDGHKFIDNAVKAGAVCVICEEKPEADVPFVIVEDSRRELAVVSANYFGKPAEKLKIVGVTGTNGKTTTTTLLKSMLEQTTKGKIGLIGTNNNLIGDLIIPTEHTTPESYELQELFAGMVKAGCEYVLMEVSSHALYLDRVYGVEFELGVFTNLTQDHLDFHVTMEAYGDAKAKLLSQSRCAIINLDDDWCRGLKEKATCPVFTYSAKDASADIFASDVELKSDGVEFTACTEGLKADTSVSIPGMFTVYNALAAISAAVKLGSGLAEAAEAIGKCAGVVGRAEVVPTGRDFTVIIDFAHSPDALENILNTIRGFAKKRVITVFGCGGDRDAKKRPIMGDIAARLSDLVVVTTDNPRTEEPDKIIEAILQGIGNSNTGVKVIEDRREAINWAVDEAKSGDVILLAGKGYETYQIIGHEKIHFDEREIVAQALAEHACR
ncbi:MAG: UDP-N-acetylmuramoyl-L-alanyl-D-glutamate--2,6-diaminopimelate ligase [Oscillospiraceae bacterium]|nr:UDP-N-acetylmuramoyl-L-alanyl-D-glutamate--2,6-diaminopimelate ligase [Oscillospiraceae bacterium]